MMVATFEDMVERLQALPLEVKSDLLPELVKLVEQYEDLNDEDAPTSLYQYFREDGSVDHEKLHEGLEVFDISELQD